MSLLTPLRVPKVGRVTLVTQTFPSRPFFLVYKSKSVFVFARRSMNFPLYLICLYFQIIRPLSRFDPYMCKPRTMNFSILIHSRDFRLSSLFDRFLTRDPGPLSSCLTPRCRIVSVRHHPPSPTVLLLSLLHRPSYLCYLLIQSIDSLGDLCDSYYLRLKCDSLFSILVLFLRPLPLGL